MKMTKENILSYLREIKPELQKNGIEKVALFGSFASNTQTVYSDIDIAIQKKSGFFQEHTAYEYFELIAELKDKVMSALHRNSDIFDLDSDSEFLETIKKDMIYV